MNIELIEPEASTDRQDIAAQAMAAAVVAAPAQQQSEQSTPLAQDLCSPLSAVLASKPDAPMHAREAAAEIHGSRMHDPATCHACLVAAAPQMTLGMLNEWLAPLQISGAGLEFMGFAPAGSYKDTMLYFDEDKISIADKMIEHLKILRRIP